MSEITTTTEYGTIPWANNLIEEGNKLLEKGRKHHIEVAIWLLQTSQEFNLSLAKTIDLLVAEGLNINYKTAHRWVSGLPEYKQLQEAKKANPSKQASYERRQAERVKFSHNENSLPIAVGEFVEESTNSLEPIPAIEPIDSHTIESTLTPTQLSEIEKLKKQVVWLEKENEILHQQVDELAVELEDANTLYDLGENLTDSEIKELLEHLQNPEDVEKLIEKVKDLDEPTYDEVRQVLAFARMGGDSRVGILERRNLNVGILRAYSMRCVGRLLNKQDAGLGNYWLKIID